MSNHGEKGYNLFPTQFIFGKKLTSISVKIKLCLSPCQCPALGTIPLDTSSLETNFKCFRSFNRINK